MERRMGQANLLGRIVSAEEVAQVVAFLCSPRAAVINGETIAVTGGVPGPIHY
jgi:NAD(P)-dependent dehydrogenase (short-subunit alcohol dehydrogenase family)